VPFVHSLDAELARAAFKQNKLDVYAGVPFAAQNHVKSLAGVDFTRKCAVIIGSEGQGVSQKLHAGAIDLAVPTVGVESLNAAMAASVILYEARRQRSLKP
jgi:RNA methyltransferase, TrmH family